MAATPASHPVSTAGNFLAMCPLYRPPFLLKEPASPGERRAACGGQAARIRRRLCPDHGGRLRDSDWLERRPGLVPGACKGKAHHRDHLGYAGRRVLVSRKWSGKTLADHRGDRKAWLMEMLDLPATDADIYRWEPVQPGDKDYMPLSRRAPALRGGPAPLGTNKRSPRPSDEHATPLMPNFRQPGGPRDE